MAAKIRNLNLCYPLFSAGFVMMMDSHYKCRNQPYVNSPVRRFPVPDDKVNWSVKWSQYKPVLFTTERVQSMPVWADYDVT